MNCRGVIRFAALLDDPQPIGARLVGQVDRRLPRDLRETFSRPCTAAAARASRPTARWSTRAAPSGRRVFLRRRHARQTSSSSSAASASAIGRAAAATLNCLSFGDMRLHPELRPPGTGSGNRDSQHTRRPRAPGGSFLSWRIAFHWQTVSHRTVRYLAHSPTGTLGVDRCAILMILAVACCLAIVSLRDAGLRPEEGARLGPGDRRSPLAAARLVGRGACSPTSCGSSAAGSTRSRPRRATCGPRPTVATGSGSPKPRRGSTPTCR